MPTHETTDRDRAVIAKYLLEAHSKERQLETALQAQIATAQRPGLDHALRDHLDVTRRQLRAIERRLTELGADADTAGFSAASAVASLIGTVTNVGLALAKGPLVMLRGTSQDDRELRLVRDCYWNEAEEIAHYRVIETVAAQLGDKATAQLAEEHRAEEEQMQRTLEGLLPAVVRGVVDAEATDIPDPAGTRGDSTVKRSARATRPRTA